MEVTHVLVVGHRRPIAKELERLGHPYSIWSENPVKRSGKALRVIRLSMASTKSEVLAELSSLPKTSHVIAGTESGVFPASRIRGWLGAHRNPPSAIVRCYDKLIMKQFLKSKGIPMTKFLRGSRDLKPEKVFEELGRPVIVKERISSGGRGMSKAEEERDLEQRVNSRVLLEQEIRGTEGSVESFIFDGKVIFENITEYLIVGKCNLVPGHLSTELKQEVQALNHKVLTALDIKWGMTHMEFYETPTGLLFGEIAIRPPGGYLMDAIRLAYGFNPWKAFVSVELGTLPKIRNANPLHQFASSVVFHPGPGTVQGIEGRETIERLSSVKKFRLKVEKGDLISPREGVGEDVGYLLACAPTRETLRHDLERLFEDFKISLK